MKCCLRKVLLKKKKAGKGGGEPVDTLLEITVGRNSKENMN